MFTFPQCVEVTLSLDGPVVAAEVSKDKSSSSSQDDHQAPGTSSNTLESPGSGSPPPGAGWERSSRSAGLWPPPSARPGPEPDLLRSWSAVLRPGPGNNGGAARLWNAALSRANARNVGGEAAGSASGHALLSWVCTSNCVHIDSVSDSLLSPGDDGLSSEL